MLLAAARRAVRWSSWSALLRPMLLLKVAVPQQNFVGILLDDSRSMQVADHDGKPRSAVRRSMSWAGPTRRC